MPIELACESCGRPFVTRHTGNRGGPRVARFCSRTCANYSRRLVRLSVCPTCGTTFRQKFGKDHVLTRHCSQKCAHPGRPEHIKRDLARASARRRYWTRGISSGGEWVRLADLPSEWQEVGRAIQEARMLLGRKKLPERKDA